MDVGARYLGDGRSSFTVWAPGARRVAVVTGHGGSDMTPLEGGYHTVVRDDAGPGTRYRFRLDGGPDLPDPASRLQPEGVHGPSEVIDHAAFRWTDQDWFGLPIHRLVLYELHVGTFTASGTFEAVIGRLDELAELGITAIELMPVAQFPGERNWGYDGVYPYAVQNSYGGPEGLRSLVDACHARGLAVVLDVVHNHLGPEGNRLAEFGPYFTDRYRTPWGQAVNFDGPWSDDVRDYFIGSVTQWFRDYHVDALRLDAIHGIVDFTARPFLLELAERTEELSRELNRRLLLIPESDLGDARVITSRDGGGLGHDAQWSDDFHHAVHTLLTGERTGYYRDFGSLRQLAKAYTDGFVYTGQFAPSRNRRHGSPTRDLPAHRFVVYIQNHDQVGNRAAGDRLSSVVKFEELKLAAGAMLLSPFVPLLFMGEEYAETAPFPYFVSHSDPELIEAVRRGRREDFAAFEWTADPPDPQSEATFLSAKLDPGLRRRGDHRLMWELYRDLLRLRRERPALANLSKEHLSVAPDEHRNVLTVRRWTDRDEAAVSFNFGDRAVELRWPFAGGPAWKRELDSADPRWGGPGAASPESLEPDGSVEVMPKSFVLYVRSGGTPP